MFEYESAPRRSPLFYLGGLLYLLASFLIIWMVEAISERFGTAAGVLVPGSLALVVSGVLFALANRRRERLLECRGFVESAEPILSFSDSDPPEATKFAPRRLTIRFRVDGDEFRTESTVYAPTGAEDAIVLLYEPGKPELAMPQEVWREELYAEQIQYAFIAVLYLLGGCGVLWLFF